LRGFFIDQEDRFYRFAEFPIAGVCKLSTSSRKQRIQHYADGDKADYGKSDRKAGANYFVCAIGDFSGKI